MRQPDTPTPWLDCPCCLTPTLPATWTIQQDAPDPVPGWYWHDDETVTCPGCGCTVGVRVTDDYAGDRIATATILEECRDPQDP